MDMYTLTGEQLYLDAVLGAWAMHRDPVRGWIHPGGSLAINEGDIYESGSYWLKYGAVTESGALDAPARQRDWFRTERGRLAGELDAFGNLVKHAHHHGHAHDHGDGEGWSEQYPTGEFCGAVFWLKLNQRLHRHFPENETYVLEMEREIYNEGLAHQGPVVNGVASGIRYFSNLNGVKEMPGTIGTCCEGQGTRLYGSLNEYLFSLSPAGAPPALWLDIYAPSTISFSAGGSAVVVQVATQWPYGTDVLVSVAADPPLFFDLALRMPSWVAAASVPVSIDDAPAAPGTPGAYLHISRTWTTSAVRFALPMAVAALPYTGVSQIAPYKRFAYTYGPVLLAATSASRYNKTLQGLVVPGVAGGAPEGWLVPSADGAPLHFDVAGVSDVLFQPAWEVNDIGAVMSSFPCFDS